MAFNILDHVVMAYQPVWGRSRQLEAVRLRVRALHTDSVDAAHLLTLLQNEWSERAPLLLVSLVDRPVLFQALELPPQPLIRLELPDFGEVLPPDLFDRIARARSRGHKLVRCGPLSRARPAQPGEEPALRYILDLWPEEAAKALQVATARQQTGKPVAGSPVLADQLYQNIGNRALAAHCLDDQRAWGLCGWPVDDTLDAYRQYGVQADRLTIVRVQMALQGDSSVDQIEDLVHQDPVLTYRLLQLVNSPVFGSRREVDTIRQAIMLLGQKNLREWLAEQMASSSTDKDLLPVRQSLVLRARLLDYLMDAGPQNDLRAEIYITGLFSQMDHFMQVPLSQALERLPLSDRIQAALLRNEGPYYRYLDVARRMENSGLMEQFSAVCHDHGFQLDDVNRALIRMLSHWRNGI